jgi:hypothetical protein
MKPRAALTVVAVVVAGCGGGGDSGGGAESGYTKDEIASALGLHRKDNHEVVYEMPSGKDCVVIRVLTSSGEVESAQKEAGSLPTSLAVNSDGNAGVIFAGFGTFSQDECVAPAEANLDSLGG